MVTLEDLIRKGYFPEEIIPPFTTEGLADLISVLVPQLSTWERKISKCCSHTIPRLKHLRRHLSIPNPINQILLCKVIEDHWTEINQFVSSSSLSMSTPKVKIDSKRAVERAFPFDQIAVERVLRSSSSRYVLRTDVSRFYPTIYTHSIPWAIHTKPTAKANRGDGLYGNKLDKFARNSMDGQTIGIPIGPDSSLIIAEIIGTAIDQKLISELGQVKGLRYMDDFYLFFNTLSEAENALSKLHTISKEFELELNPTKTSIKKLPESLEREWVSDLRFFSFRDNVRSQRTDIIGYFSKAFEYTKLYPDEYVLKYAISRIKSLLVKPQNWPLYQALLLKSAIAEPSVLPIITRIFVAYSKTSYSLDFDRISETISQIIIYHSKFSHGYELSWSLWLAKTLGISLTKEVAEAISNVEDSLVALVALDMLFSGFIPSDLDTSTWEALMIQEELYSEHWLLAYEAFVKGWLPSLTGTDYITADSFFSILKNNGVEFYNSNIILEDLKLEGDLVNKELDAYPQYIGGSGGGGGFGY